MAGRGACFKPPRCPILARRKRRTGATHGCGRADGDDRRGAIRRGSTPPRPTTTCWISARTSTGRRSRSSAARARTWESSHDRRHPRAARLLRDDERVPAGHGAGAVDRRSARPAARLAPDDRDAIRALSARDPPHLEAHRHPRRRRGGDHRALAGARRARRLRRPLERDGGGLADRVVRGPARLVPERRRPRRDPRARQPLLGLAVHRARRHLPPAQRLRPSQGPMAVVVQQMVHPACGRRPVHGRPGHRQPQGRLDRGDLRPRRSAGLGPGERRPLQGARRRGRREDDRSRRSRR